MIFNGEFTGDGLRDFEMWQAEQDEIERLLPHCDICGEPIRDKIYRINGETLCSECLDWRFAEDVEDYLDRI